MVGKSSCLNYGNPQGFVILLIYKLLPGLCRDYRASKDRKLLVKRNKLSNSNADVDEN
jgi:hypothetical protein